MSLHTCFFFFSLFPQVVLLAIVHLLAFSVAVLQWIRGLSMIRQGVVRWGLPFFMYTHAFCGRLRRKNRRVQASQIWVEKSFNRKGVTVV